MTPSDDATRQAQFESLALPLLGSLYGTALHLTRDPDDAADVVQETCLRAYRTFDNFQPGTNAKAWLFTILYSVFIRTSKKRRREVGPFPAEELEQRFREFIEDVGSPEDLGDIVASGQPWPRDIETALRELPEAFRAAVLLVDVEEMTYEEAAAVIRCPVGTLRSRLFRGRRLLFTALQDYARRAGYPSPSEPK